MSTKSWVGKGTGQVKVFVTTSSRNNILSAKVDKDYPLAKPAPVPDTVIDNIPVSVQESEEEDDGEIDILRQSSAYGRNPFGDNGGPGNDVL